MKNPKLYVGLLGQVPKGEVVENHKLEFVASENKEDAKEKLKLKWPKENVHIDGLKEVIEVDGYEIKLNKTKKK